MIFKRGQRGFFLVIASYIVTSALILVQDSPENILASSVYSPAAPALYISIYEPSANDKIIMYPADPSPGDFLIIEASPISEEAEINIEPGFPGSVSELYRVGNFLYAIIGISYETEPGKYDLIIKVQDQENHKRTLEATVNLLEKTFQTASFSMPARVTAGWTAERLAEDREKVRQARSNTNPYPLWNEDFILPLEGRITSEYGAIRIINNNPPRRHAGIDIAEETGTPINAPNSGIVRLADDLLSGGKTVIIDHGLGLSSTYMHLDSIEVSEGQKVKQDEVIGTLGMTGYATGPHLHWEVNLNGIPVNPDQLIDNDLLWIPPAYVQNKLASAN